MDDIKIITTYLGVWFWQTFAIMFLLTSFIMFALPRTLTTSSFYVSLFLIFVGCEYMSLKRKKELENES